MALAPDDTATELAEGVWQYYVEYDLDRALAHFERIRLQRPSDPEVHTWISHAHRRAGRWDAPVAAHEEALRLDLSRSPPRAHHSTARMNALIEVAGSLEAGDRWADSVAPHIPEDGALAFRVRRAAYRRSVQALAVPSGLTLMRLRLGPINDPLREHPRFHAVVGN